jgi:hypothetical protein
MGNTSSQDQYFDSRKREQLNFLSTVEGYLENTSEWISIFKKSLQDCKLEWSRKLLKSLKHWEHFQDLSSKVAFAWDRYNSQRKVPRVDQQRVCIWRDSIINLETFSFEVDQCKYKRTLRKFLTNMKYCILSRLITEFKKNLVQSYSCNENGKLMIKTDNSPDLLAVSDEINLSINKFCSIMLSVIPKFFLDLPETIDDMNSIVRDAVISGDVLTLLVTIRKEIQSIESYLQGLQRMGPCKFDSKIAERLESNSTGHFSNAISHLVEITHAKSMGDMQDSIALLMNQISLSLFDPAAPDKVLEDDFIIEAFLVVIIRGSAPDLPLFVDIIENFMDCNTKEKKDVGKGVAKLTFLLEEVENWDQFIKVRVSSLEVSC